MRRIAATALGIFLCGAGCAQQGSPRSASSEPVSQSPATRPSDPALLSLDEIEPRPVLSELVAAATTRPATTRSATTQATTRPAADPPLEALYIYAQARAAQLEGNRRLAIEQGFEPAY